MNIPSIKALALGSVISVGSLSLHNCKSSFASPLKSLKASSDSLELVTMQRLHEDAMKKMESKRKTIADSLSKVIIN